MSKTGQYIPSIKGSTLEDIHRRSALYPSQGIILKVSFVSYHVVQRIENRNVANRLH